MATGLLASGLVVRRTALATEANVNSEPGLEEGTVQHGGWRRKTQAMRRGDMQFAMPGGQKESVEGPVLRSFLSLAGPGDHIGPMGIAVPRRRNGELDNVPVLAVVCAGDLKFIKLLLWLDWPSSVSEPRPDGLRDAPLVAGLPCIAPPPLKLSGRPIDPVAIDGAAQKGADMHGININQCP